MISIRFRLLITLLATHILTGCQPPSSGEPAGIQYPQLYIQLMQTELPEHLPVPVEGVLAKQIQDTWGAARSQGRTHEGVDIFAKKGTPVLSATQGIVMRIGVNNLGGNVVWVLGPDLSRHYYAHLDTYADHIEEGDWIEAGEIIGYVGNTGNAQGTPPHLHYGIYFSGKGAVNPFPFLVKSK